MMYKTKKIRIFGNEQMIQQLLQYEQLYHYVLLEAIHYIKQNPFHPFSNCLALQKLANKNRWYVYRIALQKSSIVNWSIGSLSSRWHPNFIHTQNRVLCIDLDTHYAIHFEMEECLILNGWIGCHIQHVDLLHEGINWSVCFLFTVKGIA